ncbi:MAG: aminoacyl--tRNA ligase-related protein [Candidatus Sungbacteria bacterium]|nr:aminoacyl--tRNA ligase-related protein [bacterium]MDZ4286288.1 aminoacyl--tRNA ligase-related protein [Candidatus Sungbacteria bacterium]
MRQSRLFGKTVREAPKDEVSENAKLLERGAFVAKSMAGVYEYLPLGFRVLENINAIIREEINAIGGQEMFLAALQPKERWEKSGRWKVLCDIMYQFQDHSGREVGLASTHEEAMTEIALRSIHSYRDLPLFIYQIQTKFRDEPRAKSGIIRGREFLMKDLYSFHRDEKDLDEFYTKADKAYQRIFSRCGLQAYVTQASGGTFTKQFTHEYQVLTDAGEDWILYGAQCGFSQNKEISSLKEGDKCPSCTEEAVALGRSVEVGNIFKLGTKFSEQFGLHYLDEAGVSKPVVMGSYGIGPGRLMGTIVEVHHDERGIVWPESVAPFRLHLIELKSEQAEIKKAAEHLYESLLAKDIEVLYDDRDDKSAGEKFADADLLGIPWRAVISEKTISKEKIELKERSASKAALVSEDEFFKKMIKGGKRQDARRISRKRNRLAS